MLNVVLECASRKPPPGMMRTDSVKGNSKSVSRCGGIADMSDARTARESGDKDLAFC